MLIHLQMTVQRFEGSARFVLVVRPVTGYLATKELPLPRVKKCAIAFFEIRGIESFFHLASAINHPSFGQVELLWNIMNMTVLVSIIIHGALAAARDVADRKQSLTMFLVARTYPKNICGRRERAKIFFARCVKQPYLQRYGDGAQHREERLQPLLVRRYFSGGF